MDFGRLIKRSFDYVWSYRALWLFGFILAATTAGAGSGGGGGAASADQYNQQGRLQGVTVRLPDDVIIGVPDGDVRIDFTDQDGIRIELPEDAKYFGIDDLRRWFQDYVPGDIKRFLIAIAVWIGFFAIISLLFRYTSEASVIGMVSNTENTGERMTVRQGWRMGWSLKGWRLFLIDLLIKVPVFIAFLLLFGLALTPLFLWASGGIAAGVTGTIVSISMIIFAIILAFLVSLALSPLMQVFKRACILENLSPVAAVRRGFQVFRANWQNVALLWLVWIATRVIWFFAIILVFIVCIPLMLFMLLPALFVSAVPGLIAGSLSSYFISPPFSWILGFLFSIPFFGFIVVSPVIFVDGLAEIFKSNLWTLGYRDVLELSPMPLPDEGVSAEVSEDEPDAEPDEEQE